MHCDDTSVVARFIAQVIGGELECMQEDGAAAVVSCGRSGRMSKAQSPWTASARVHPKTRFGRRATAVTRPIYILPQPPRRNSPHRVHHALDDRRLADGADLKGRGKAVVERTLHRRKLVENPDGANFRGPAAEAPAELIHLAGGRKRSLRRLVVDGWLDLSALFNRILTRRSLFRLSLRSLAQQRLDVAGMIFAHRREPAFGALMIGSVGGPGWPGPRIFLPNGFSGGQALRRSAHVFQGCRQICDGGTRQQEEKCGTTGQRHASTPLRYNLFTITATARGRNGGSVQCSLTKRHRQGCRTSPIGLLVLSTERLSLGFP